MRTRITHARPLLRLVILIGVAVASAAPTEGRSASPPDSPPLFDTDDILVWNGMLAFKSQDVFDSTVARLRSQLYDPEIDHLAGVDSDHPVLLSFEEMLGHRSLRRHVEEFGDDADDLIGEPIMRSILSPSLEYRIGDSIFIVGDGETIEILKGDGEMLRRVRNGELPATPDVIVHSAAASGQECCFPPAPATFYTVTAAPIVYDNGKRRLKVTMWVWETWPQVWIGTNWKHQRRTGLGLWVGEPADEVFLSGCWGVASDCGEAATDGHADVTWWNKKEASHVGLGGPGTSVLTDHHSIELVVRDNGAEGSGRRQLCDDPGAAATPSFVLPTPTCLGDPVLFDGSATTGESDYFLEIYETDQVGGDAVIGSYWSAWFAGEVPNGPIDLRQHFTFLWPGVYRVKLAVQNACTNWEELVQWVTVKRCGARTVSRDELECYLSRAITMQGMADPPHWGYNSSAMRTEDIRMVAATGARFVGRVAGWWGTTSSTADDLAHYDLARQTADQFHAEDPCFLLQAAVFEIVSEQVNNIDVPSWVFEEFQLPVVSRTFQFDGMIYADYPANHVMGFGAVPDMSKLETKLWFYYRARSYIDAGFEGIHFGQVELMDDNDPGHFHWWELLSRVRNYAAQHARRHFVLCDAHTHGVHTLGQTRLLFDFHSFPLRIREASQLPDGNLDGILTAGGDAIYGVSAGGITPMGWNCASLPFLVEFDNVGSISDQPGQPGAGLPWVWGYDEISWFARQSEDYRNSWLAYAWDRVKVLDSNGFLQMPGMRGLVVCPSDPWPWPTYHAATPSAVLPDPDTLPLPDGDGFPDFNSNSKHGGYGQETTIGVIWAGDDGVNWPNLGCGSLCPTDTNGDGVVDANDLLAVLSGWGPCPGCSEDIHADAMVDLDDLIEVLAQWGPCP